MPSPFPGMNPYLEQAGVWHDFHQRFIIYAAAALRKLCAPRYFVGVETNLYIHELAASERQHLGRADVALGWSPATRGGQPRASAVDTPVQVLLPVVETEEDNYLEVRDQASHELVTVIELLSPSNKRPGPDREQYLAKRATLLRSTAHFVEIDLLRGGGRLPMDQSPVCDYCVLVSRVEDRPQAGVWPIRLRDPLPVVPVPLQRADGHVLFELQPVLHRTYDEAGYSDLIYSGVPEPPLFPADAAWAEKIVVESAGSTPDN